MADPDFAAANISFADVTRRLGVAGFGAWWLRELTSIVPERLRAAIERRRLRPVIAFDGERITFWRPSQRGEASGMRESASIAATADAATLAAQGRAVLDAIFATTPGQRDVTLAMGPRQVLRRKLTLPVAVEDNLRATIGYDIDRLTPFKPEDLHFDAAVVDRDSARREITVDVVTARRRVIDQALALARSFGANVVAIVADAPRDAATSRINLLTPEDRDERNRLLRWQFLAPLLLLLALIAAVVIVPLLQKRDYAITMMNTADEAATRARQSDQLRSELDRMVSQYNFALERKYTTPGVAQVLDEVTRLLPDDTWLTQFEIKSSIHGKATQRELFMRGESANAGKLISLLENATLVGQATPRSPTTKLQPGPGESFDIGAQLKTIAMPPKIALTESIRQAPNPPAAVIAAPVRSALPQSAAKAALPSASAAAQPLTGAAAQPPAGAAQPASAPASLPGHPSIVKETRPLGNARALRETPAANPPAVVTDANGTAAAAVDEHDKDDAQ